MEFTDKELVEIAEFICGRVDALKDIAKNNVPKSTSVGINKAIKSLESLDVKLRPFYIARGN